MTKRDKILCVCDVNETSPIIRSLVVPLSLRSGGPEKE
jgi:hypothetical protein